MVKNMFTAVLLFFGACLAAQETAKPQASREPTEKEIQEVIGKIARDGLFVPTAPFKYPDKFRIDSQDLSGNTWRESVSVPGEYSDVKKTLGANIKKCGYRLKHDIELSRTPASSLMAWEKTEKVMVVMLFESEDGKVCFSWGYFEE